MDQIAPATSAELPRPQKEIQDIGASGEVTPSPVEAVGSVPVAERLSSANNAVQAVNGTTQTSSVQAMLANDNVQPVTATPLVSGSLIAEDADVIEKAWVQMAKLIVENTKNDPRRQSKELSHVKHDYISKRFNKEIKLTGE